jgi:hypothetical protein
MNVRFFGGTRAQYDSLPTPRNKLGLYFCADTRELFWGDLLLTDGTRIVRTEADLPNLAQAADGITYFVEETRNGYVISSNRTKWIKVIQAPNGDGSSVRAISFAGIELEEADGVFTIDRRCAREALGIVVPDGLENEEIEIASTDYVAKAIATLNPTVEEVKTKLETEVLPIIPTVQETILPTVQKVETEVIPTVQELAKKAVTQDWVKEQGYLKEHQDLSEYAKKTDLDELATAESVEELANTLENTNSQLDRVTRATEALQEAVGTFKIPTKVSELENDVGYITENELSAAIAGFDTKIQAIEQNYVTTEILEQYYITKEEIANTYVTEDHAIENYVTKDDAKAYVTTEQVTEVVTNEVTNVVTEQIEEKVTEAIEKKIESGNIVVRDTINYDTWD